MHRWFAALFLAVTLLAADSALALGLGDIKTRSALNEPMQAEISLLGATRDELTTLEVRLASAETFERYGIDKAGFLNGLKFRVRGGAQPTIEITSSQPITEPFVTMLIEAVWPRGRLLREYTVLLDPPTYAAPVAAAPSPQRRAAQPTRQANNSGNIRRSNNTAAPATNSSRSISGSQYSVQRRDTLWEIARDIQPDQSVSINQVMVAIFEANPAAFDGNINRLKAGAVLNLPSEETLFSINRSTAAQEVQRQNRDWRGGDSGTLVLTKPDDDVRLGAVSGGTTGTSTGSGTAANAELARLQSELAEKERLLSVRNEELARLQAALARGDAADDAVVTEPVDASVPADAVDPAADGPYAGDSADTPAEAPISAGEIYAEDDAPVGAETPDSTDTPAVAEEPVEEPVVTRPSTNVVVARPQEPSLIEKLMNSTWVWLGAGALIILGLFGFVASRRGKDNDPTGTWESLDAADLEDLDGTLAATGRLRDINSRGDTQRSQVIDEALAKDALMEKTAPVDQTLPPIAPAAPAADAGVIDIEDTFSSDTAINFDQSDPLKEADFHMAYGLFDQAADLVKGAINVDGSDPELKAKLCEIYFQWGNQDGFVDAAGDLKSVVTDSDPRWNKVVIMGQQLAPAHDLFSGAVASSDGGDLDLSFDAGEIGDIDAQLGAGEATGGFTEVFENSADDAGTVEQMADISGIDFEFDDAMIDKEDTSTSLAAVPAATSGDDSGLLDFNLDDAMDDAGGTVEQILDLGADEDPTTSGSTEEMDIADLDLSSDTTNALLDSVSGLGDEDLLAATGATSVLPDDYQVSLPEDPDATVLASTMSAPVGDMDDLTKTTHMSEVEDDDATGVLPAISADDGPDDTAFVDNTDDVDLDIADLTSELRVDDINMLDDATLEQQVADTSPTGFSEEVFGGDVDSEADTGLNLALDDTGETNIAEVGTKLDLARAYVDMGDPEGARSILGEVVSEGDTTQREEAQKLLDSLS